jgi:hypothetical protein
MIEATQAACKYPKLDKEAVELLTKSLFGLTDTSSSWRGPRRHPNKAVCMLISVLSTAKTLRTPGEDEEEIIAKSIGQGVMLTIRRRGSTPEYLCGLKKRSQNAAKLLLADRDFAIKVAEAFSARGVEGIGNELDEAFKIMLAEATKAEGLARERRD